MNPAPKPKKKSFLQALLDSPATRRMAAGVGVALVSAVPGIVPQKWQSLAQLFSTLLLGSGIFHAAQEGGSAPAAADPAAPPQG